MVNQLRKGHINPDKTYVYRCGCGFGDPECPYCYGNDLARCKTAIKTARGSVYYGLLKTILGYIGKTIFDDEQRIERERGDFTVADIGYLSLVHDLNFKATCEWLEETGAICTGTYDRLMDLGIRVRDVLKKARETWGLDAEGKLC